MSRTRRQERLYKQALRDAALDWGQHTFTLDRQIAAARERMGEDRWHELNREWG